MNCTRLSLLVIVAASAILWSAPASAGAWTQAEGNYYAKFWARGMAGSAGFFADGEVRELEVDFRDLSANLYTEYGVTDAVTVSFNTTPFGNVKVGDESQNYVGEQGVGVRYGLLRGAVPLSLEGRYGYTPGVGRKVVGSGVVDGMPWFYSPTLSTQSFQLTASVGYGGSVGWVNLGLGAKAYTEENLDEAIEGVLNTGTSFGPVAVGLSLFYHEPLGDVEVNGISGAQQTRYLGVVVGGTYWITDALGVGLGAEGVAFAAANAAAPVFTLSVEAKSP
jgi:hypothetical protein